MSRWDDSNPEGAESTPADPFNLARFLVAQRDAYERALEELRAGEKRSHWIWFIFPQLKGLGASAISRVFAIGSLEEARAYLAHPVLGARAREATQAVLSIQGRTLRQILGTPDDLKFRSSMTLFAEAEEGESVFRRALAKFCPEGPDERTLAALRRSA